MVHLWKLILVFSPDDEILGTQLVLHINGNYLVSPYIYSVASVPPCFLTSSEKHVNRVKVDFLLAAIHQSININCKGRGPKEVG